MSHPIDRGHRLHHRARLIKKRVAQRPSWFNGIQDPRRLARAKSSLASTSKPCSCFMCGNPRHHFNQLTRAEKKSALFLCDWLNRDKMEE